MFNENNMNNNNNKENNKNIKNKRNTQSTKNKRNKKREEDPEDLVADILCLLHVMKQSLPDGIFFNPFSTEAWPEPPYTKHSIFAKVDEVFQKAKEEKRQKKIRRWGCQMFAEHEKYYKSFRINDEIPKGITLNNDISNEEKHDGKMDDVNNNNSNNGTATLSPQYVKFVFNRLFRAMIEGHNNYVGLIDYSV